MMKAASSGRSAPEGRPKWPFRIAGPDPLPWLGRVHTRHYGRLSIGQALGPVSPTAVRYRVNMLADPQLCAEPTSCIRHERMTQLRRTRRRIGGRRRLATAAPCCQATSSRSRCTEAEIRSIVLCTVSSFCALRPERIHPRMRLAGGTSRRAARRSISARSSGEMRVATVTDLLGSVKTARLCQRVPRSPAAP
jgi:hypothetical protein